MKLFHLSLCWVALFEVYDASTLSSTTGSFSLQPRQEKLAVIRGGNYPNFYPPTRPEDPDDSIRCEYPAMGTEWESCSSPSNRQCWLRGPGGQEFNISSNYKTMFPQGQTPEGKLLGAESWLRASAVLANLLLQSIIL